MEYLFVYGTLQQPAVQLFVLGRVIPGTPDRLVGYKKTTITLGSGTYPIIQPCSGSEVDGLVLTITLDDLPKLDHYETAAYQRVRVTLKSGILAWLYCKPE